MHALAGIAEGRTATIAVVQGEQPRARPDFRNEDIAIAALRLDIARIDRLIQEGHSLAQAGGDPTPQYNSALRSYEALNPAHPLVNPATAHTAT